MPDPDGPGAYYEFAPEPCVELAFFGEGREAANGGLGAAGELVCADPAQPAAGAVCCAGGGAGGGTGAARAACSAPGEYAPFAEAAARCALRGAAPCAAGAPADAAATAGAEAAAGAACGYHLRSGHKRLLVWTARACAQRLAVDAQGRVAVRHALGDPARSPARFRRGDGTTESGGGGGFFRVRWCGGLHPGAGVGRSCGAGCAPAETGVCECELHVEHTAPFGAALPQSAREAEEALHLGAPPPGAAHALCTSAACNASAVASGALLYLGPGGAVDRDAVFAWTVNGTLRHFANRASHVWVGGLAFRNPPHFSSATTPDVDAGTARAAEHEVEALLDHLAHHPNTAPFVATHLARQLVNATGCMRRCRCRHSSSPAPSGTRQSRGGGALAAAAAHSSGPVQLAGAASSVSTRKPQPAAASASAGRPHSCACSAPPSATAGGGAEAAVRCHTGAARPRYRKAAPRRRKWPPGSAWHSGWPSPRWPRCRSILGKASCSLGRSCMASM